VIAILITIMVLELKVPPACPLRMYRAASCALSVSETDAQVLNIIECGGTSAQAMA
jgi:hypothetical protein